jgi:hypothetical protein
MIAGGPYEEAVRRMSEAMNELDDWASGRRSHTNTVYNTVYVGSDGTSDRGREMEIVATMDAMECVKLSALVQAYAAALAVAR